MSVMCELGHGTYVYIYMILCIIGERRDVFLENNGIVIKRLKTKELYKLGFSELKNYLEKMLDSYLL